MSFLLIYFQEKICLCFYCTSWKKLSFTPLHIRSYMFYVVVKRLSTFNHVSSNFEIVQELSKEDEDLLKMFAVSFGPNFQ